MNTYRTAEIASIVGVHPNMVRFYEKQGFLPPVPRTGNGYRVYSERHLLQLRLIRLAFRAEILSDNLRNEAVAIVTSATAGKHGNAIHRTALYRTHLNEEIEKAKNCIKLTEHILNGKDTGGSTAATINRREAAARIGVSVHVLRDWERNGLVVVPGTGNRRQYGDPEMNRLKIISVLRGGGYSQMAIRRMLTKLDRGETDLQTAIDTPEPEEDIVSVADCYITSLSGAIGDTGEMRRLIDLMQAL